MVELVHSPVAELAAEPELVLARAPRQNVGNVAGCVIAAFRRGDTNLVESTDDDVGRPKNGLAADQRVRAQKQPEGRGIEGVVGVVEELVEGADPKQDLVGHPGAEHGIPYQGVVLYVQRSDLEVVAQIRTGRRQSQTESGWLGLAALSAKPAEGERVVSVDVPVNLGHAIVAEAGSCAGREIIVDGGRQTNDGARPKVGQQRLGEWVYCYPVLIHQIYSLAHPGRGWFRGQAAQSKLVGLVLVPDEEKQLVLDDRPSQGATDVLVGQGRWFGHRFARYEEWRTGRVIPVAVVIVSIAVELIGTALDHDVDGAARVTSGFGVRLGNGRKVFHRVDRHDHARDSGDTALVDCGDVVPRVVVVGTVNLPVHLIGAGPVERAESAYGIATIARRGADYLREVAPVQGQILHRLLSDGKSLGRRSRVQCNGRGRDLYGGRCLGHTQLDGQRIHLACSDRYVVGGVGGEARCGDRYLIGSQGKVLEDKPTVCRGCGFVLSTGGRVCGTHLSVRHHAAGRVCYSPVDRASESLRSCQCCKNDDESQSQNDALHTSPPSRS